MMPSNKKNLKWIVLIAVMGFGLGYWSDNGEEFHWSKTELSGDRAPADDSVPCPTAEEAASMIKKYKISFGIADWKCESSDTRTHFLKALSLTKKYDFTPPTNWDPLFRAAVMDLETWLSKYTSSYDIDPALADTTIAYYKPTDNKTFMTERIKNYNSAEVFGILVHENRHAEVPLISHVTCQSGDFPNGGGACDQEFTDKMSDMGAYNFAALYELGSALYNDKLSAVEKDALAISALDTLTNRFNQIPGRLGYFHEVLTFLDTHGDLFVLNPLTMAAEKLQTTADIQHIENVAAASGFSIFTKDGKWLSWNLLKGFKDPYGEILGGRKIIDAARGRIFNMEQVMDTYITNGSIEYLDFDRDTKKKKPTPFSMLRDDVMRTDLARIVYGQENEVFFISSLGKLYRSRQYGNEPAFFEVNRAGGADLWRQGMGGPLYNSFYLTAASGDVFHLEVAYKENDAEDGRPQPAYEPPTMNFSRMNEISDRKALKYLAGFNAEYMLSQSGDLLMRRYSEPAFRRVQILSQVKDFAVVKSFSPSRELMEVALSRQKVFEANCKVKKSEMDPWLRLPLGIDADKNLMTTSLDLKDCVKVPTRAPVLSFKIANSLSEEKQTALGHTHYSSPVLVLETTAGPQLIKASE